MVNVMNDEEDCLTITAALDYHATTAIVTTTGIVVAIIALVFCYG